MMVRKIIWAARGVIYSPLFGKFGYSSYLGKPISLLGTGNIYIGNKVRIQPGIRMETANGGKIIIKDNTSIGQNVHITADGEELVIGENSTILGNTFITNLDHDYREIGTHIMEQKRIVKTTSVGKNCFIGFGACIQAGTVLGKQCIVGANSVVRGHYSDYSVIAGVPARVIKRYNAETQKWEKVAR